MRGLGNLFKGAVFIAGLAGVSATFAQQDPRIPVYFDNVAICPAGYAVRLGFSTDPATGAVVQAASCEKTGEATQPATLLKQVSLSRPTLTTRSAYDLAIFNNHTNDLGRLYFRVKVSNPNSTDGSNGKIEKILNIADFTCYATSDSSKTPIILSSTKTSYDVSDLTCTSSITLTPGQSKGLTIGVITPSSGDPLMVEAWYGGYEGSSTTGQGCCAQYKTAQTSLIDTIASGDYQYNTTTFLTSDQTGLVFTGNGKASRLDFFATNITAPSVWTGNPNAKYDIATITERSIPDGTGRCKQSKLKYCQESNVSLPNVVYSPPPSDKDVCNLSASNAYLGQLLEIRMSLDANLVKGKVSETTDLLSAIRVRYDNADGLGYNQIYACGNPAGKFPCICNATYETTTKTINFLIKHYKNGGYYFD